MKEFLKLLLSPFMIASIILFVISFIGFTWFLVKLGYAIIFKNPARDLFIRLVISGAVFAISCCILAIYDKLEDGKEKTKKE